MLASKAPKKDLRSTGESCVIGELIQRLQEEGIRYTHLRSNWRLDTWLKNDGDLDLLVGREDIGGFTATLYDLGFKRGVPAHEKTFPGVSNFYGFDPATQRIVNIHAHFQLLAGNDLTLNFRLPAREAFLNEARLLNGVSVASPEMDLILFVLRAVLRWSLAESAMRRITGIRRPQNEKAYRELIFLEASADPAELESLLRKHFPMISIGLFEECLTSLRSGTGSWRKLTVGNELRKALSQHARTSGTLELLTRFYRGSKVIVRKMIGRKSPRKNFEGGGLLLAFLGGDGAGKTTCVNEITDWLSEKFNVHRVHIGRPPKSLLTLLLGGVLRVWRIAAPSSVSKEDPGVLFRLRMLCTARDRIKLFRKLKRLVAKGELVITDRYPVRKIKLMDAPRIPVESGRYLSKLEEKYYKQILPPDKLFVLRVKPETAVQRKLDEPAEHVFQRSTELWNVDWNGTDAVLIDAQSELETVLEDVREKVWESL